jgi:superfamily II DNA or RNA helicase
VDVFKCFAGAVRVVCATVAFGMGMDLPNIGLVVHWNAAHSFLDFVQQIGRAGRDGNACMCITMYDRAECQRQERFDRKATDPRRRDFELSNMQKVRHMSCVLQIAVYWMRQEQIVVNALFRLCVIHRHLIIYACRFMAGMSKPPSVVTCTWNVCSEMQIRQARFVRTDATAVGKDSCLQQLLATLRMSIHD